MLGLMRGRTPLTAISTMIVVIVAMLTLGAATASADDSGLLGFMVMNKQLTECGNVEIEWENGVPPLYITAIPAFHVAHNITIPEQTQNTTGGKHSFAVPYPAGTSVVFILSDADGFATGGVSEIFKIGARTNVDNCDLIPASPPFNFDMTPSTKFVSQCENINFVWDSDQAHDGAYVTGVIPNGEVIQWYTEASKHRTGWTVNMAAGTQVIWAVWDGQGNQGGTSDVFTVGDGDDFCLVQPYSSTPAWSPTGDGSRETATSTHTHTNGVVTVTAIPDPRPKNAADLSGGAIAGIVVAVVVVVLIFQVVFLWFCCRRQIRAFLANRKQEKERERNPEVDLFETGGTNMTSLSGRNTRTVGGPITVNPFDDPSATTISPFTGGSECPSPISPVGSTSRSPFSPVHPTQHSYFLTSQGSSSGGSRVEEDSERSVVASAGEEPVRPTLKAQLTATNPDDGSLAPLYVDGLPPPVAPRGGFRRHQDAGRINVEPEVEDLPPNYDPEWERDRV